MGKSGDCGEPVATVEIDLSDNGPDFEKSYRRDTTLTCPEIQEPDGLCGLWCWTPGWLQFFNTPKWFLVFLCICVTFQSMTINGLNGVVIPTVEKRYQLPSERSGLISGAYDIAAATFVLPISYFGERAHKPRWLGIGSLLIGIGAFIFAMPQFIGGKYTADHVQKLESCAANVNHSIYTSTCEERVPGAYALLFIGQMVIGIGVLPLYTVGVAFLDEIANPKVVHFYIGAFYVFAAFGPAIGFLLGSLFLSQYVDLGVSDHPAADDPNFVGRWWAGYVVAGVVMSVIAVPLLMYPRHLPNTAWIREVKQKKQLGTGRSSHATQRHTTGTEVGCLADRDMTVLERLKQFVHELLVMAKLIFALLLTPVLLANTLGATSESFAVNGLIPFITKYFQSQFGVTASRASLLTGAATLLGVAGGIFFSSWLMKRRKVEGPRLSKYTAGIAFIAVFFVTAFLVHCKAPPIVGVDRPYPGSTVTGSNRCRVNYTHSCISNCGCTSERYDPVCGSDGYTYPTPCLAGCQGFVNGSSAGDEGNRIYVDCTCIVPNLNETGSMLNATATMGVCTTSCKLLPVFMILFTCLMFFTFMNNVPAVEAVLQSVPFDHRTMATGVQWLLIRLLANVPGPVFYGFLLDKGCHLWQLNCCKEGNCWEYDNTHMSNSMFAATMVCKCLSFVFFFISWQFFAYDVSKKREKAGSDTC